MYGVKKRHDDGQSVDYKFKTQVTSKNTVTGGGGGRRYRGYFSKQMTWFYRTPRWLLWRPDNSNGNPEHHLAGLLVEGGGGGAQETGQQDSGRTM